MASLPRILLRPTRHVLTRAITPRTRAPRVLGVLVARGMATAGNAPPMEPPMEPHKEQPREMAVGELDGVEFTVEPVRRVGEDETTMRARLVYQSRKRGILETDLLLSTFADEHLPTMTRDQMVQYDFFLDENDWDIYYWATQEEPSSSATSSADMMSPQIDSTATDTTTSATQDTSSPSYGSPAEATTETATETAESATASGGVPLTGEHGDTKADAETDAETDAPAPFSLYAGEWAQTLGTFKPAYRPVPARWHGSEILAAVRNHVQARKGEKGGMAFMPALKS